ncbi:hypothetical protein MLD38_028470 [Melastoma candidum]|uniref:Uncharacterized protein n=1 Tax=Melastoma candidum TaxID=119954 RepID=A0ACB9N2X8_9MYRT|nr:hypothetical protein MLD38_028470 [Melastoma candidum]
MATAGKKALSRGHGLAEGVEPRERYRVVGVVAGVRDVQKGRECGHRWELVRKALRQVRHSWGMVDASGLNVNRNGCLGDGESEESKAARCIGAVRPKPNSPDWSKRREKMGLWRTEWSLRCSMTMARLKRLEVGEGGDGLGADHRFGVLVRLSCTNRSFGRSLLLSRRKSRRLVEF